MVPMKVLQQGSVSALFLVVGGEISQLGSILGTIKLDSLGFWRRNLEHTERKHLLQDTLQSGVAKSC